MDNNSSNANAPNASIAPAGSDTSSGQGLVRITRDAAEKALSTASHSTSTNPDFKYDGFSQDQIKQEAIDLVRMGALTPEQGQELLRTNGITIADQTDPVDQVFPPASEEQFTLPRLSKDSNLSDTTIELDRSIRAGLKDGGFTREMGSFLIEEAVRNSKKWKALSADEQKIQEQKAFLDFQNHFKSETPKMAELARHFLSELEEKHPKFYDYLEDSGLRGSAMLLGQIAVHASRRYERAGRKGQK